MQAPAGPALKCRALHAVADHLFTTRGWGLGSTTPDSGDGGWTEVAAALAVDPANLARVRQVHGATVALAAPAGGAAQPSADIILTDDSVAALAVQAADCLPLLIADRRTGAVAAAHAGWRGLAALVPQVAVAALTRHFGSRPSDLVVAIGPSIGACCYEVGVNVRDAFIRAGRADVDATRWFFDRPQTTAVNPSMPTLSPTRRANHWFFDSWSAARHQLESAGVPADQIHVAALCTASHPEILCSYRRDGMPAGRMAAAIRARLPRATSVSRGWG